MADKEISTKRKIQNWISRIVILAVVYAIGAGVFTWIDGVKVQEEARLIWRYAEPKDAKRILEIQSDVHWTIQTNGFMAVDDVTVHAPNGALLYNSETCSSIRLWRLICDPWVSMSAKNQWLAFERDMHKAEELGYKEAKEKQAQRLEEYEASQQRTVQK